MYRSHSGGMLEFLKSASSRLARVHPVRIHTISLSLSAKRLICSSPSRNPLLRTRSSAIIRLAVKSLPLCNFPDIPISIAFGFRGDKSFCPAWCDVRVCFQDTCWYYYPASLTHKTVEYSLPLFSKPYLGDGSHLVMYLRT